MNVMNNKLSKCVVALCAAALMATTAFGAATAKPEPVVVDTSSAAGRVIDESPAYNGGNSYKAKCAFDGDWATMPHCWIADLNTTNPVAYLVYEFNEATVVDGIRIHNSGDWDPIGRAPNTWTFEGSSDNDTWTVLDARSGEAGWTTNQVRGFSFPNTTAYKYYRFSCSKNNYTASANYWVAIYEIQFYVNSAFDLTSPALGGVVDSSSAYVYNNYQYIAGYAFDSVTNNNNSRWLASPSGHMYVTYGFNNPTRVNGISLITPPSGMGSNTSARAPRDWTFSGSNDGSTWDLLDTQAGETNWGEGEERYYEFANTTKYKYYKYDCTANNSASDVLQLMEIEFSFHDSGLPCFGNCSVTRADATSLSVSAIIDLNGADSLSYIVDDGQTTATNAFATSVQNGETKTATISGLSENKTYAVSILAQNSAGSTVYPGGSFYTGELTLGDTTNASEASLAPGTVAVSREHADNVPLTVYYTITGTTGTQGLTWAEPVGIVIPAGQKTGYLLVTPIGDVSVGEDIEVTVALAAGNYDIPASGNSATLTIENDDNPAGWDIVTITNAFDNPAGGFFGSAYGSALNNSSDRIIRFVRPENAAEGLRMFSQYSGSQWTTVDANANIVTRDWMMSFSGNAPTNAATVNAVSCATQEGKITGLGAKNDSRVYVGSWYVPAEGTYSFRMHMGHVALFSLDGKRILRQATTSAVTTNGVWLAAGWHSFYAAFVSTGGTQGQCWVGPASGETLGFSFSADNAELTKESPGSAFETGNGYRFSQAFSDVLVPSMWAKDGDVVIDCTNVQGDLRVMGQLASTEHEFRFVNLPAGRSIELGRSIANSLTGWQELTMCAYLDWTRTVLPAGVNIRFEGASTIDRTWASAGQSAFSLGNNAILFVDTPNFFGTLTDEFHYPAGLYAFHAARPDVLGDTAKIFVPSYCGFGFGGAPFSLTSDIKLPVTRVASTYFTFRNDIDLATGAVINKTLTSGIGDRFMGEVYGSQGGARITGYASYMTLNGPVNIQESQTQQIGCRTTFAPATGSKPSSISGVLYIGSGQGNELKPNKKSGWDYSPPTFCYCPETPGEHPLSVGTLSSTTGAQYCPENVGNNSWNTFTHMTRQGANISTCSNNTINVAKLAGSGIHLRVGVPIPKSQAFDERKYEDGAGPANFVFGEINGVYSYKVDGVTVNDPMPIFVSSNVNITVTNITKATAFHYEVMTNGVNEAFLDIEGTVADGTTITATDIAMLPARIKGFTGDITLTETNQTETVTYPVVFDFDNHGGVPVGGCDGSGNLVGAPTTGTIELSFAGEPVKGEWGILRFDNANGLLDNWTIEAPQSYRQASGKPLYLISVQKNANGFIMKTSLGGLSVRIR